MIYTESDSSSSSRIRGTGGRRLESRFQYPASSLIKFGMPRGEGSRCGEGWRRIANREPRKGECDLTQSAACTHGLEDELPANPLSGPLCRVGSGVAYRGKSSGVAYMGKGVLIASSGALSGALRGDGGDADGGEAAGASSEVPEEFLTESAADAT